MFEAKIYREIENIKWFSKCGKDIPADIGIPFKVVDNWPGALDENYQEEWQKINMNENRHLIATVGDEADYDEKYELNALFFTNRVLPLIQEYTIKKNIDFSIASFVRWAVINHLLEEHYRTKQQLPMFFSGLLNVYRNGHFPCGWDGPYPGGYLVIY